MRRLFTTLAIAALPLWAACSNTTEQTDPAARGSTGSLPESRGGGGGGGGGGGIALSTVAIPRPANTDIVDRGGAVRLGKALFWDTQLGSDGQVACATCHFHAGADNRMMNTLHPGPNGTFESGGVTASGQAFNGASITLAADDIVGSQGVSGASFVTTDTTSDADTCTSDWASPWYSNRRVTGRQAPTVIGAVFMRDLFWDGRANHVFNGLSPFGDTANASDRVGESVDSSGLASQAVGPPLSGTEMSCGGRAFNGEYSLGSHMVDRVVLQYQQVSPTDGVLGSMASAPGNGLRCGSAPCTYRQLISIAFGPDIASNAENQFSRVFGQAIQAYESTLVPDRTPLDLASANATALTAQQNRGLSIFQGKGNCTQCHAGAELSDATLSFAARNGLINEDGGDQGFHNIGVRPTVYDLGRASNGPNGVSFSVSGSSADRGAFKTPSLRNVGMTAPYMHTGGLATLRDVVAFYNRGGDFANAERSRRIRPLSLSSAEQDDLIEFLANGLTDCRVRNERAPFDHPALAVPNGASLPAVGAAGLGSCP